MHMIDDIALPDGISLDELGQIWLVTESGEPYSGPYDTLEEAVEAQNA